MIFGENCVQQSVSCGGDGKADGRSVFLARLTVVPSFFSDISPLFFLFLVQSPSRTRFSAKNLLHFLPV